MTRLARTATRHAKLVLACSAAVVVALSMIGFGLVHQLSPAVTVVPGSESSRAEHLAHARFGPSVLIPILIEGPKAQIDAQGPQLVRALRARPHTRVLSAWDTGSASAGLRPRGTAAAIVVSVDRPMKTVVDTDQAQVERTVAASIRSPLRSYVTGQAALDRAFKDQAIKDVRRLTLIAAGVLFLLLLVGLRAPLAAVVLTAIGGSIALSSMGALAIAAKFTGIDPLSMLGASMLGMALGVGLSMLVLDRFREEQLASGGARHDPAGAVTRALARTGPAVVLAGTLLILAQLLASTLGPTEILQSLGIGFFACATFALIAAVVIMPAVLELIGGMIVAGTFGVPHFVERGWQRLVAGGSLVRRWPIAAGALATALLVVLALPAIRMDTGPLHATMLPPDSHARVAFERMQKVMGAGWPTPFNVIVASDHYPITSTRMLTRIDRFERQIAADPEVYSVVGPGALRRQTKDLGKLPTTLDTSKKMLTTGPRDLRKLENGLGQAGAGATQLQTGLQQAAQGAGQISGGAGQYKAGSAQARAGTVTLHAGLATAQNGSAQVTDGLAQAYDGARALQAGATKALAGSMKLTSGFNQAVGPVTSGLPALRALSGTAGAASSQAGSLKGGADGTVSDIDAAISALESMSGAKSDPRYAETLTALRQARDAASGASSGLGDLKPKLDFTAGGVDALVKQTDQLGGGLTQLRDGASKLQTGIGQLRGGNAELGGGISQLQTGGGQLTGGLGQLRDGAGALENGIGQLMQGASDLQNGAGQLQSGLVGGVGPTGELITGLGVMQAGVGKFAGQLPSAKDIEQLQRQSPGLFDSGYFVLAAVQGAPAVSRNQASFALNLARGGTAGQIAVVPKHAAGDPRTDALGRRLKRMSDRFAAASGAQVALGGPASELADFASDPKTQIPWVVVALVTATLAVLMLALRAVLLPIVSVAFNLLATAATFGMLQLLFGGSNPPLGGPGWIDPVDLIETFTAVFGLSLLFQVVLLVRTRDAYVRTGDPRAALGSGMRHTAGAATGVGLVMLAAVIPFATTELINVRSLMVGVAIVVLLDVLLVRPVLLPAAARLLGHAGWWPTRSDASRPTPAADSAAETRRLHGPPRPRLHRPPARH